MEELTEDFEILIVAWLKSSDENATNLAHSLAKYAEKAFFIQRVSNSVATEYAEFCVRCDREKLPLLCLEDYIKQYCC